MKSFNNWALAGFLPLVFLCQTWAMDIDSDNSSASNRLPISSSDFEDLRTKLLGLKFSPNQKRDLAQAADISLSKRKLSFTTQHSPRKKPKLDQQDSSLDVHLKPLVHSPARATAAFATTTSLPIDSSFDSDITLSNLSTNTLSKPIASTVLTPNGKKALMGPGSLSHSPVNFKKDGGIGNDINKFVIYGMIAKSPNDNGYYLPDQKDRINFEELVGHNGRITDDTLDEVLLKVEVKIREWIKAHPELYFRTVYVGLAENANHRFQGHNKEIEEELKEIATTKSNRWGQNRKARFISWLRQNKYDVKMSSLIYNVDSYYHPHLEVLVGLQFNVLAKANTLLGNKEAWQRVEKYRTSKYREEELTKRGLFTLIEDRDEMLAKAAVGS